MIENASDQAFLFVVISVCLGACFVWAFWEIEEARFATNGNVTTRDPLRLMDPLLRTKPAATKIAI
jgi:hypothetical protein